MTTELILDSLQRRMRALHSLYADAVTTMDVDQVNHFERDGVVPIAFSLFHIANMIDASFMLMTGTAADLGRRRGTTGSTRRSPITASTGRRGDGAPAHRRLRGLPGVPARGVRPGRGVAGRASTRPS